MGTKSIQLIHNINTKCKSSISKKAQNKYYKYEIGDTQW